MHTRPYLAIAILLLMAPVPAWATTVAKPTVIDQGAVGSVGGSSIGVISVNGPADNGTATVTLDLYARGVPVEYTMRLRRGGWLPTSDGMHEVEAIVPPTGAERGRVAISAIAARQFPGNGAIMVYLTSDGTLRLNGPETHGAVDMRIKGWGTDPRVPAADVQWQPSQFAPEDTDTKTIRHAHLDVGKHLVIGRVTLVVSAIEKETTQHPAWIGFRVGAAP
ncbi:hypothetical protein [Rhizobium sp. 60-20]|uniref:hypothetical protein n=1 Tax=Rhizobium sp. 60-20 TaxID=1895819 RepID=UPI000AA54869|nr:hypothetical protein [Rhizobium sp. 60-20]